MMRGLGISVSYTSSWYLWPDVRRMTIFNALTPCDVSLNQRPNQTFIRWRRKLAPTQHTGLRAEKLVYGVAQIAFTHISCAHQPRYLTIRQILCLDMKYSTARLLPEKGATISLFTVLFYPNEFRLWFEDLCKNVIAWHHPHFIALL